MIYIGILLGIYWVFTFVGIIHLTNGSMWSPSAYGAAFLLDPSASCALSTVQCTSLPADVTHSSSPPGDIRGTMGHARSGLGEQV